MLPTNWGIHGNGHEGRNNPSFKHRFPRDEMNARSAFHVPKIDAKYVTPKLYSRPIKTKHIYDVRETGKSTIVEAGDIHRNLCHWPLLNSESYGWWYDSSRVAREIDESRHNWPPLSSESYGWWYDRAFSSRESRFGHRVRDPALVQSSEIIHWQDQKLFGLGHSSYA